MRLDHASDAARSGNNFDLLRLLAAISVVFAHSFNLLGLPEPFPHLEGLSWGFLGVLVFFSISGFLISRSWAKDPRIISFVVKRALRLMPALIVALLLSAVVLGPLVTSTPVRTYLDEPGTKAYVINNATLQSDYDLPGVFEHNSYPLAVNGSLWTLPLEVKAYAFVALIGLAGLLTRWRALMIGVVAFAVLACIDSVRSSIPGANHFVASLVDIQASPALVYEAKLGTYTVYADMFAAFTIGATLYALRRWVSLRWELALLVLVAWLSTIALGGSAPEIALVILGPYIVLFLAYRTRSVVRLPKRMGDYSYGAYIYAFPVQQTISSLSHPHSGWLMFLLAMPITLVLATLSWHLIERPALDIKRRLVAAESPAGTVA
jgi:peptidoglycan/LPS O-acetylase OafA/YrhL